MSRSGDPLDSTLASDSAPSTVAEGDEAFCAACGDSFPLDREVCPKDGARLTKLKSRPDALLGRVFEGRYEIRTSLGSGGMGTVYRGWQLSVDREVAIKVIHPKLATDRVAVKRFLREVRLSSRLSHPSIVNVYDFGQAEDSILYLVMELLRGHTLARELAAQQPLPLKRVTTIAIQLCDALDSAHGQGIIHRDLKPGNIVILDDPPGRDLIKVLDFGLAKSLIADTSSLVTHTSAIIGTPLYMPPEQIDGKPSDQRADLYSLGCILYQMLSGLPPFLGDNVNAVLAAHASDEAAPLPPSVPSMLVRTIEQLMAKDPAQRLASAAAVRAAVLAVTESGYLSGDIADTTPDTDSIALAVTDPAMRAIGLAAVTASAATEPEPARPSRAWLTIVAIAGFAAISLTVVLMVRNRDAQRRHSPPSAAPAAIVDAHATPIEPIDAAAIEPVAIDAAPAAAPPIDAAPRRPKDRPKPDRPKPAPDAAIDIEFIPSKP